jgi:hypothetical protein
MNDRLKQFVSDHREEFDSEEPDLSIWDKIRKDLDPGKKNRPPWSGCRTIGGSIA